MLFISYTILLCSTFIQHFASGRIVLPTFSWDPRNEMFKGDICGGDEGYAHIAVPIDSEMYFVCPSVALLSKLQIGYVSKANMYENMFMVTKDQFNRCNAGTPDGENTRQVMLCNTPKDPNMIKFNRFFFTSLTTQITFLPNHTYYFIATSNGHENSLSNRKAGRCETNKMKIAITICDTSEQCEKNENLCAIPKQKKATSTTPVTTSSSKAAPAVNTIPVVVTPKSIPQTGDHESNSGDRFDVIAIACLIAGLVCGVLIGVGVVLLTQKYAKRFQRSKKCDSDDNVFCIDEKVNRGYRDSKEIKRLLSTNSSDRYSNIPKITSPQLLAAPVGSIPV